MSLLTLGVRDLVRAHAFYVTGLGWRPRLYVPGEVCFLRVGDRLLLSLWDIEAMAAEAGDVYRGQQALPITLAHNVPDGERVAAVLDDAVAAGGTLISPAMRREWGGVSGYFADPEGYRWEVAHNPGPLFAPDGSVPRGTLEA